MLPDKFKNVNKSNDDFLVMSHKDKFFEWVGEKPPNELKETLLNEIFK